MRKLLTISIFSLLVLFTALIDRSFFMSVGGGFQAINLTLTISIYLLIIIDRNLSLLFYLSATLLSALLGNSLIVIHLLYGLVVLLTMDWIFESFLTNRSYYTLIILGTAGWFAYYTLFSVTIAIMHLMQSTSILPVVSLAWVSDIFFGSLVLMVLLSLAFLLTNFLSKKFRSYFIIS